MTFRRRLLGSTALWGAATLGAAVAFGTAPALAVCNIVGVGGDLTGESNVSVLCDTAGGTETTSQGDGFNDNVVFTVGGGASLNPGVPAALSLNNGNTITVNGTVTSASNLYTVSLGGIGNTLTVNNGGSIANPNGFLGAVRIATSGSDVSGNVITVNSGGLVSAYTNAIYMAATSPYVIRNNRITIGQGGTATGGSAGIYLRGDAQNNTITVNGSVLQTLCGCGALQFSGTATGNTVTVGSTGLIQSTVSKAVYFTAATGNTITVNAGGRIAGVTGGLYVAGNATGNVVTIDGTVQGTGAGSHGIYFRGDGNDNRITIGAGGLVGGVASGITFGIVENNNTIINSGTLTGAIGINLVSGSNGQPNNIVNNATGIIRGTAGTAIDFSQDNNGGSLFVENRGLIDGNLVFGKGDDRLTLFTGQSLIGTINGLAGNDQLILDGTGSASFANTIVGNSVERLTKQGSGTWTLGASQTFSGGTTVTGGTLLLGSGTTLTSDVTVNGGTLGGNGVLGGGLTLNGGTVSPGASIGTLTVTGNANLSNGTTLIEVDRTSSDRLIVGGAATLARGTVQFTFLETVLSGSYTFVNAGSVAGQFGTIILPASLFLSGNVTYTPTTATLNLTHTSFATAAPFENQQATAAALDRGYFGATGDAITVLDAFNAFTSAPAAANAFGQIGGEIHTSLPTTGVINAQQFTGAVRQHLRREAARGGGTATAALADANSTLTGHQLALASAGERIEPVQIALGKVDPELGRARGTAWIRGFGLLGSADGAEDRASHDLGHRIAGVAGGADYAVSRSFTAGVALGYANTQADLLGTNADEARTDTISGAIYGMWNSGSWFADASLGYAYDDYKTERRIIFNGIDRLAEAKYHGREVFFDAEAGYRFRWGGFRFDPSIGLAWTNSRQSSFDEAGANSLNLSADSRSIDSIRASVGARVAYGLKLDDGMVLVPEARLRYQRELGEEQRTLDARFAGINGGTFTVRGAEPGRDAALLGVGLTANLDPGLALFADYDADLRSNADAHAITGGLRFTW